MMLPMMEAFTPGIAAGAGQRLLSRGAENLLKLLRWYQKKFKRVFPLQEKLASFCKVTIRQLQRYLQELRDAALIIVKKHGHLSAEYFVAQEVPEQNVMSESGLRQVCVASVSGLTPAGPYCVNSSETGPSHHAASVTNPFPARKPPQRMGAIERYKIWAKERGLL
jgi:hypothetical protein